MTEISDEQADQVMGDISTTFRAIMHAKHDALEVPTEFELVLSGAQAEAMGSARHIADEINECGYTTDTEYVEQADDFMGDEQHRMRIIVTSA